MNADVVIDSVSTTRGHATLILRLCQPDQRPRKRKGICAPRCVGLAQEVLVSYVLEAELRLRSGRSIDNYWKKGMHKSNVNSILLIIIRRL